MDLMGRSFENRKNAMAKTAGMKTKIYSKYGREIYVCAKAGGTDPSANLSLRSMIERAKKDQVPTHVIEKAIAKAAGGGGEEFLPAQYEGYGPGGTMVIVESLTDNPTRTIADVRHCFTKCKSKIGSPGSAAHMFDHLAILGFAGQEEEATLEALMEEDVDVHDIELQDNNDLIVFTPPNEYFKAKTSLEGAFGAIEYEIDEIQYVPKSTTVVAGDDVEMFDKFLDMLNELDDVTRVYHNAEFE